MDLVPEQEVRGTVTYGDGEVCRTIEVMLMYAGQAPLYCASIRTASEGVYSFHVGSAARGTVGLSGTIQALMEVRQDVPVSSGSVADLRHDVDKLHIRLVDAQGVPVTSYRVGSNMAFTLTPHEYEQDTHAGGLAWTARDAVVRFPWLMFHLPDDANALFLVPAAWLAKSDRTIHEVSVASFVPEGVVEVTVVGGAASYGKTVLRLRGKAELDGVQIERLAPSVGPWRIDGVPIGSYDYETICYSGGLAGNGEIVVSAGRTTGVRLTRR